MLTITPSPTLKTLEKGEEIKYTVEVSSELKTMGITSVNFSIFDADGLAVDADYNGGVSFLSSVISFGVLAYEVNKLKLEFIVTCDSMLPDTVTPYEFIFYLYVKIKDT